jgi:signal transduction histidine kinase
VKFPQIIRNLVSNALKFTPPCGLVTISGMHMIVIDSTHMTVIVLIYICVYVYIFYCVSTNVDCVLFY